MSERNAMTEFLIEVWNDDVNGRDDDEFIATMGVECVEHQRQCIDSWIDGLLELDGTHYTLSGRPYMSLSEQIVNIALRDLDYDTLGDVIIADARDALTRIDDATMYLVDGSYGQFMFQELVSRWRDNLLSNEADLDIVEHEIESCEFYHDVVSDVLDAGMVYPNMSGHEYTLYSGDGIWSVRSDLAALLDDDFPS